MSAAAVTARPRARPGWGASRERLPSSTGKVQGHAVSQRALQRPGAEPLLSQSAGDKECVGAPGEPPVSVDVWLEGSAVSLHAGFVTLPLACMGSLRV